MCRTSMTISILYARSTSTKSSSVRVECPMVKKRSVICVVIGTRGQAEIPALRSMSIRAIQFCDSAAAAVPT